ncbi:TlpA family protein disulfide reductase [Dinghuibacter silviterrae]|uniref:Thioredoxin-like protein n=1 Tax=Dinghuibacter silviterrae TaxID=1539049 RepID=A0A4V6QA07_9BACT|nr:thioredoxin family protein [Dinghuibacter silviterrae]TDX01853.1 thioredoxin-like protein [Dinghuibacter silviterrae]
MKKISFLLLVSLLSSCSTNQSPIITGLEGKPMPSYNLLLMDSTTRLNTVNIPTDKPIVLFLFSPNCPFCRAQTADIITNIKNLNEIRLYMISSFPFSSLKTFYNHYQLNKYPNIIIGRDDSTLFGKYFQVTAIPYIAVYDKGKRLKQVLIGNVGTKTIKKAAL